MRKGTLCWTILGFVGIVSLCQSATVFTEDGLPPLGTECHPTPLEDITQVYVIGYGSLISSISKNKTSSGTHPNIPVVIEGFARKFNCRGDDVSLSTTFLGADEEEGAQFNGVAFRISDVEALRNFDKRESFYCRKKVEPNQVKFLVNESNFDGDLPHPTNAEYWIYSVKDEFKSWPSEKYPIVQSYVDTFLSGCLEMDETYGFKDYADNCVKSTQGWDYSWVNDRLLPRRPWAFQPKALKIDKLLNKHIPESYRRVKIEGQVSLGGKDGEETGNKNSAGGIGSTNYFVGMSVYTSVLIGSKFTQLF